MLILSEIVKDVLFVKIPKAISENVTIKITNMQGAELLVKEYKNGCNDTISLNTQRLKVGMYYLQFFHGKNFSVKSFVKKRK